jgi:hypothetical protein
MWIALAEGQMFEVEVQKDKCEHEDDEKCGAEECNDHTKAWLFVSGLLDFHPR